MKGIGPTEVLIILVIAGLPLLVVAGVLFAVVRSSGRKAVLPAVPPIDRRVV